MAEKPCNDREVMRTDGVWERIGARAIPLAAYTRPAPHSWEYIVPRYFRCRYCGAVQVNGEPMVLRGG